MAVFDTSIFRDRIPHRKRDAEKPLTADGPVAGEPVGPVLESRLHIGRVPVQFPTTREQLLTKFNRLDEPLTARHDFERTVAFLVELHRVRNRTWLSDQIARLFQLLDDLGARLCRREPNQLIVVTLRAL